MGCSRLQATVALLVAAAMASQLAAVEPVRLTHEGPRSNRAVGLEGLEGHLATVGVVGEVDPGGGPLAQKPSGDITPVVSVEHGQYIVEVGCSGVHLKRLHRRAAPHRSGA